MHWVFGASTTYYLKAFLVCWQQLWYQWLPITHKGTYAKYWNEWDQQRIVGSCKWSKGDKLFVNKTKTNKPNVELTVKSRRWSRCDPMQHCVYMRINIATSLYFQTTSLSVIKLFPVVGHNTLFSVFLAAKYTISLHLSRQNCAEQLLASNNNEIGKKGF